MFQIIAVIDFVYFFNSVSEQNAKHLFFSKTKNQDLLLIEFEGRTGSYGPSFFRAERLQISEAPQKQNEFNTQFRVKESFIQL